MQNIMKLVDLDNNNRTHYILRPEEIYQIHDSAKGCVASYSYGGRVHIAGFTARQLKRSIQDQLDEHSLGYLKTAFEHQGHKGTRYLNVNHILSVMDIGNNRSKILIHIGQVVKIEVEHSAQSAAYQIRRVLNRQDQDEEICCVPEPEEASEDSE